jgi:ATP-dependent RNA helicase DDX3X
MYQNYGSSFGNDSSWGIEERSYNNNNQSSKVIDDSQIKPGEIRWSLLKFGSIPSSVKREYDDLLNDHYNKKKIKEETFFKQKVTDYIAYYKGKEVDMSYYKSKDGSTSFDSIEGVHQSIIKNLKMLNFTNMTAIQQTTLPLALKGHDVIGCSDTGSGKTLAFLIPIITQLLNFADTVRNNPNSVSTTQKNFLAPSENFPPYMVCPYVLIMAPTRELAEQINAEARKIICNLGLHSVAVYGGIQKRDQGRKLEHGSEILVATPGRLNDMLKQRMASLRFVKYLILDEADRMLDMGFYV